MRGRALTRYHGNSGRALFQNNLWEDLRGDYATPQTTPIGFLIYAAPTDVQFNHNTLFVAGGPVVRTLDISLPNTMQNFVFTNNLMRFGTGIQCDSGSSGTSCLNAHFPGATVQANVFAGDNAQNFSGQYPSGIAVHLRPFEASGARRLRHETQE